MSKHNQHEITILFANLVPSPFNWIKHYVKHSNVTIGKSAALEILTTEKILTVKHTKMSKLSLLPFLLIGASVSVMLFLSKTPFDSFRPLMLQIWDQSWNEAKKFIFHPDCRCHRLIPEQQASCCNFTTFQANPPALDEKDWSLNEHPRWQQCWGANHLNSASAHSHILERFPRATPRQPLLALVKRWALWAIASTGKNGHWLTSWRLDTKQRRHLLPTWSWQCVAMRKQFCWLLATDNYAHIEHPAASL